jgi:hypothetical protein
MKMPEHVTLYRGQRVGIPGQWFTATLEDAQGYAGQYRHGEVVMITVPFTVACQHRVFGPAGEFGEDEGGKYNQFKFPWHVLKQYVPHVYDPEQGEQQCQE